MDYKPVRKVWRDVQYDSQLEADWAATLTAWGMEYVYHPGRLFLSNGDVWEPDFQLEDDFILEVKGAHNSRIDKAWRASAETDLHVIVGRSGWMPAGSDLEYAGAVWEPEEYVLVNAGSKLRFTHQDATKVQVPQYSAIYAYARGHMGIRMFKAVGDEEIK